MDVQKILVNSQRSLMKTQKQYEDFPYINRENKQKLIADEYLAERTNENNYRFD